MLLSQHTAESSGRSQGPALYLIWGFAEGMSEPKESLQSSHLQLAPSILRFVSRTETTALPQCSDNWHSYTHMASPCTSCSLHLFSHTPHDQRQFQLCVVQVTPLQQGWDSQEPHQGHQHGSTLETGKASFPVPSLGRIGRHEPVPKQSAHPTELWADSDGSFG